MHGPVRTLRHRVLLDMTRTTKKDSERVIQHTNMLLFGSVRIAGLAVRPQQHSAGVAATTTARQSDVEYCDVTSIRAYKYEVLKAVFNYVWTRLM
jgi:hypothetical protein